MAFVGRQTTGETDDGGDSVARQSNPRRTSSAATTTTTFTRRRQEERRAEQKQRPSSAQQNDQYERRRQRDYFESSSASMSDDEETIEFFSEEGTFPLASSVAHWFGLVDLDSEGESHPEEVGYDESSWSSLTFSSWWDSGSASTTPVPQKDDNKNNGTGRSRKQKLRHMPTTPRNRRRYRRRRCHGGPPPPPGSSQNEPAPEQTKKSLGNNSKLSSPGKDEKGQDDDDDQGSQDVPTLEEFCSSASFCFLWTTKQNDTFKGTAVAPPHSHSTTSNNQNRTSDVDGPNENNNNNIPDENNNNKDQSHHDYVNYHNKTDKDHSLAAAVAAAAVAAAAAAAGRLEEEEEEDEQMSSSSSSVCDSSVNDPVRRSGTLWTLEEDDDEDQTTGSVTTTGTAAGSTRSTGSTNQQKNNGDDDDNKDKDINNRSMMRRRTSYSSPEEARVVVELLPELALAATEEPLLWLRSSAENNDTGVNDHHHQEPEEAEKNVLAKSLLELLARRRKERSKSHHDPQEEEEEEEKKEENGHQHPAAADQALPLSPRTKSHFSPLLLLQEQKRREQQKQHAEEQAQDEDEQQLRDEDEGDAKKKMLHLALTSNGQDAAKSTRGSDGKGSFTVFVDEEGREDEGVSQQRLLQDREEHREQEETREEESENTKIFRHPGLTSDDDQSTRRSEDGSFIVFQAEEDALFVDHGSDKEDILLIEEIELFVDDSMDDDREEDESASSLQRLEDRQQREQPPQQEEQGKAKSPQPAVLGSTDNEEHSTTSADGSMLEVFPDSLYSLIDNQGKDDQICPLFSDGGGITSSTMTSTKTKKLVMTYSQRKFLGPVHMETSHEATATATSGPKDLQTIRGGSNLEREEEAPSTISWCWATENHIHNHTISNIGGDSSAANSPEVSSTTATAMECPAQSAAAKNMWLPPTAATATHLEPPREHDARDGSFSKLPADDLDSFVDYQGKDDQVCSDGGGTTSSTVISTETQETVFMFNEQIYRCSMETEMSHGVVTAATRSPNNFQTMRGGSNLEREKGASSTMTWCWAAENHIHGHTISNIGGDSSAANNTEVSPTAATATECAAQFAAKNMWLPPAAATKTPLEPPREHDARDGSFPKLLADDLNSFVDIQGKDDQVCRPLEVSGGGGTTSSTMISTETQEIVFMLNEQMYRCSVETEASHGVSTGAIRSPMNLQPTMGGSNLEREEGASSTMKWYWAAENRIHHHTTSIIGGDSSAGIQASSSAATGPKCPAHSAGNKKIWLPPAAATTTPLEPRQHVVNSSHYPHVFNSPLGIREHAIIMPTLCYHSPAGGVREHAPLMRTLSRHSPQGVFQHHAITPTHTPPLSFSSCSGVGQHAISLS